MRYLFTALCLLITGLPASSLAEPLRMGFIVPQSGSAGLMGESLVGVVKVAGPKNLQVAFEDDRCDGKAALSAYMKLRREGIRVFYMACSGSILAVAPKAKQNGDVILTTYAGSARIRETGDEVLRFNPDAVSIAEALARSITPDQQPTIILYEEQEYAQSLASRLGELLGGSVVDQLSYRPDAASFSAEILRIKQKAPKSVILIPVGDGAARTILRQFALNQIKATLIGEVNLCDYPFSPSEFSLSGFCMSARFSGPQYEIFLAKYADTLGRPSAYPFYDAMAFDLLVRLDSYASSNASDPVAVKAALLKDYSGKFATYRLTANGEAADATPYLTKVDY